ncbi:TonB-dependent receptor family protein [Weeksellaceae bacterium TAE3-ERU29]|nr:TonB-dependent receptor family protein [Weeksellaceae bacterium TAE3-ERU29]
MKDIYIKKTIFLTLFVFSYFLFSQEITIKGKVIDNEQMPAVYTEVLLKTEKDSLLSYTFSDGDGTFSFSVKKTKQPYIVSIEQFGQELFTQTILPTKDIDLKTIKIDNALKLDAVVAEGKKKLIEQKVDRLVYNVENSIASQGMTAVEILKSTPLLRTDDNGISIAGKSSVAVMINDRMVHMSGRELMNYLSSLSSDNIQSIEVITTPPAKYEASGNSGLVNIILKKNPNIGWSGSLRGTYQKSTYHGERLGATLNYQREKINTSLKVNQFDLPYNVISTRDLIGKDNAIYSTETRKDRPHLWSVNYALDYQLSPNQNLGFIYDYSQFYFDSNANGNTRYEHTNHIDSTLVTLQNQKWDSPAHTLNTYYDLKLDTLGKKISFTGNVLIRPTEKVNNLDTKTLDTHSQTLVKNSSDMKYNVYSGQMDITLPYDWSNWETGVKYTLFTNDSDVKYFNYKNKEYIINPLNSNVFKYKENNYSAYISWDRELSKKWSAKAGLRYEYTTLEGSTPGEITKIKSNYGKLFPTAYLSYKPNSNNAISIDYSRRISRPSFQELNPFRWYTNPYIYYTGNPNVKPSFSDNVSLSYNYKGKITASLYNNYSKGNNTHIAYFENGINSNVMQNAYNQNKTGLRLGYYETFFNRWEVSFNATGTHTETTPIIDGVEKFSMNSYSYSIYNTIAVDKDKKWYVLINHTYNSPFLAYNIYLEKQIEFSVGVRTSFFDRKLSVSANVSDLFKTLKNEGYSYNNGYRSQFSAYNDYQRFTLSLSYNFGSSKVKGANKRVNFEDKYRAN